MLYVKLALSNIRKSLKDYTVYFITLILGVCVFYLFNSLGVQSKSLSLESQNAIEAIGTGLSGLTLILSFILGALMVYANNYLIKRRKKELGLYQVLGMNKVQVSSILFFETLVASLISFVIGICLGVFLSQFMIFLTASFFREKVMSFDFIFSWDAFLITLKSFVVITLVMMVFNLRALKKVDLIDLMKAKRMSEKFKVKNPYIILGLFIISIVLLAWSYMRLEQHGYEVLFGVGAMVDGWDVFTNAFFQTTAMMIAGTILFFYSAAQALVKIAQGSKKFYFSGLNAFSLRQISANAATATGSVVVICLLLFFSLTFITFGMSLAGSIENLMSTNVPYDAQYCFYNMEVEVKDKKDQVTPDFKQEIIKSDPNALKQGSVYTQIDLYDNQGLGDENCPNLQDIYEASGILPHSIFKTAASDTGEGLSALGFYVMKVSDYNKIAKTLGQKPLELGPDEYGFTCNFGNEMPEYLSQVMENNTILTLFGHKLHPASKTCITGPTAVLQQSPVGLNPGTLIVSDSLIPKDASTSVVLCMIQGNKDINKKSFDYFDEKEFGSYRMSQASTWEGNYTDAINQSAEASFISIYIGFIMVAACAAIISIQQLSFAVDSQDSYEVLRKLGSSDRLVHGSLCKQVSLYFIAPLALACSHSYIALKVLLHDLGAIWPISISGAAIRIGIMFLGIYVLYFVGTYLTCRNIIDKQ